MTSTKIESTEDQASTLRESWDETTGFGMVMTRVLDHVDMSMKAAMAYVSLTTFVQRTEGHKDLGKSYARRKVVAARAKMSVTTFDRAVKELVSLGLVTVERRKHDNGGYRSSIYRVFDQAGEYQGIVPVEEGVASDCSHPPFDLKPPSPQIEATLPSDRRQGGFKLTHLEQTTTQTTRQTTGSDQVLTPALGGSAAKAGHDTSTKSSKGFARGGAAALLVEQKETAPVRGRKLKVTLHDDPAEVFLVHPELEDVWTWYLGELTARGYTVDPKYVPQLRQILANCADHDHDPNRIRQGLDEILNGHRETDSKGNKKVVKPAEAPYHTQAVATWLSAFLHGASPESAEYCALASWRKPAPVEPEPTVVIPEQRQATMDTTPPVEEDVEPEVDEVDDDPMPVGYAQYDTEDEEGIEEPVRVAPVKSRPIVVDIEALPWGTEQEIVQAAWPDGVPDLWVGDLVDTATRWLEDFLNLYRQEFPEEGNTASAMNVMVPDVAEKVGHLARTRVVKVERLDPIQALRARLREKVAA